MNTYPKNRAINSIFVMLMSQAYSGTVKNRYSSLRLSMPSHPLNYMYFLYILTFITQNKRRDYASSFCFVAYINSHISSCFSFSKSSMILLPTTTPSHIVTISSTCSFVEIPNPATTGKCVCDFTFSK